MIEPARNHQAMSVAQIRELETSGFARGLPMMQRAGRAAAVFVHERTTLAQSIVALVGPGNNGGDALVAALELLKLGHNVSVVMPQASPNASNDAREALANWVASGETIEPHLSHQAEFVIDGLFGIGLSKPLEDPWQTTIDTVNTWQAPTLALDIPSGLHADTGQALGRPVRATWTLCFIAPNLACSNPQNTSLCGACFVEDLGIDDSIKAKPGVRYTQNPPT